MMIHLTLTNQNIKAWIHGNVLQTPGNAFRNAALVYFRKRIFKKKSKSSPLHHTRVLI